AVLHPGPGVVADEARRPEAGGEALGHAHRLARAADERGAGVEQVDTEVLGGAVRVVDDHGLGPGGVGAVDRGVGVTGHQLAAALVAAAAGVHLLRVGETDHALHVHRDVHLHRANLTSRPHPDGSSARARPGTRRGNAPHAAYTPGGG